MSTEAAGTTLSAPPRASLPRGWTLRNILYVADAAPESAPARVAAADLAMRARAAVHVAVLAPRLATAFSDDFAPSDPWREATELLRVECNA